MEGAASSLFDRAVQSAATANPEQAVALIGSSAGLLNEIPSGNSIDGSDGALRRSLFRDRLLGLMGNIALTLEVSGPNIQLASASTQEVLLQPESVSNSSINLALDATEVLLRRRGDTETSEDSLSDGPGRSVLDMFRVASNAGLHLTNGSGILGSERVSNQSQMLTRALLEGAVPGEAQRVIESATQNHSVGLRLVAGRIDTGSLEPVSGAAAQGGGGVLAAVGLSGSTVDGV